MLSMRNNLEAKIKSLVEAKEVDLIIKINCDRAVPKADGRFSLAYTVSLGCGRRLTKAVVFDDITEKLLVPCSFRYGTEGGIHILKSKGTNGWFDVRDAVSRGQWDIAYKAKAAIKAIYPTVSIKTYFTASALNEAGVEAEKPKLRIVAAC